MNKVDYITDARHRIDVSKCFNFLKSQPWCKELTIDLFKKSVENSYCLAAGIQTIEPHNYSNYEQTGFLRVITDYSQFAYITDVIVFPEHQGKGISKSLLSYLFEKSQVKDCKEFFLITDTGGVYEQYGFQPFRYQDMFWSRSPKNFGVYDLDSSEYFKSKRG